jgi:hypothetical protein
VIRRLEFHRPEDVEDGEDGYGHDGLIGYCRGLILRSDQAALRGLELAEPPYALTSFLQFA